MVWWVMGGRWQYRTPLWSSYYVMSLLAHYLIISNILILEIQLNLVFQWWRMNWWKVLTNLNYKLFDAFQILLTSSWYVCFTYCLWLASKVELGKDVHILCQWGNWVHVDGWCLYELLYYYILAISSTFYIPLLQGYKRLSVQFSVAMLWMLPF